MHTGADSNSSGTAVWKRAGGGGGGGEDLFYKNTHLSGSKSA